MKYIKLFENYNDIERICHELNISKFEINKDESVDVEYNVYIFNRDEIPIKFNNVGGDFVMETKFKSFKNCPVNVGNDFYCKYTNITSIENIPLNIGGALYLSNNKNLESIKEFKSSVGDNFYINNNSLKSLEGCPKNINGNFDCKENRLTSLKYGPTYVDGFYDCSYNSLTSLDGIAEDINGSLTLNGNKVRTTKGIINLKGTIFADNLPNVIYDNRLYIRDIVKYQYDYKIWNNDDTLNVARFITLLDEIKR